MNNGKHDESTKPEGPFAIAVDRILARHVREIKEELKVLYADHESRLRYVERVILESRAKTEPPGAGP